jgi:hypothetical protein
MFQPNVGNSPARVSSEPKQVRAVSRAEHPAPKPLCESCDMILNDTADYARQRLPYLRKTRRGGNGPKQRNDPEPCNLYRSFGKLSFDEIDEVAIWTDLIETISHEAVIAHDILDIGRA